MAGLRDIPVKFLKGVGPQRSRLLAEELGIESYHDLLHHFPSGYIDRSRFYHIRELSEEMPSVQIRGRFISSPSRAKAPNGVSSDFSPTGQHCCRLYGSTVYPP